MSGDAGIVIVTYNSANFLRSCLESALSASNRVVVVDNASADNSVEVARSYHGVHVIANRTNRGFAAAVNQGIVALDTNFVLLLNPDAVIRNSIDPLIEALSRPEIAAAAGLLVDTGGVPQIGFAIRRFPTPGSLVFESLGFNRIWPSNPVNRRYRCLDLDLAQRQPAEQPAGAFLMIRRDVWEKLGGFDEAYWPLWYEEVDFLKRAAAAGYHAMYVPDAVAVHSGAHSLTSLSAAESHWYWYDSLLRFSAKHFRPMGFRAVAASVLAGVSLRAVTALLAGRRGVDTGYGKVLRHAAWSLWTGPQSPVRGGFNTQSARTYSHPETTTPATLSKSRTHGL
jgi:GT2 family glycosyltransferase